MVAEGVWTFEEALGALLEIVLGLEISDRDSECLSLEADFGDRDLIGLQFLDEDWIWEMSPRHDEILYFELQVFVELSNAFSLPGHAII